VADANLKARILAQGFVRSCEPFRVHDVSHQLEVDKADAHAALRDLAAEGLVVDLGYKRYRRVSPAARWISRPWWPVEAAS